MGKGPKLPRGVTIHRGKLRISFVYRGVRCREGLGLTATKSNIEFSRRKRDIVLDEIARGVFDYLAHFPESPRAALWGARRPDRVTVGSLLDRWLGAHTLAPSTRTDYDNAIENHIKPKFGDWLVEDLKKSDVKLWLSELSGGNKRKNNILIPLRGALDDAVDDEIIARSPLERVRNLSVDQDEPDPFEPDEIERILEAMDGAIRRMFRLAFWTGLRTGELIALAWEDVDLKAGTAYIHRNRVAQAWKEPKTKAGKRHIDLQDDALEALLEQKSETFMRPPIEAQVWRSGKARVERFRPVWLNPEGRIWIDSKQVRDRCWEPAMRKSGVRYRTAYTTRHTFASLLLSWGANPIYVAQQMGHSDWGMIRKRYGRWIRALSEDQRDLIRHGRAASFGKAEPANDQKNGPTAAPRKVSD